MRGVAAAFGGCALLAPLGGVDGCEDCVTPVVEETAAAAVGMAGHSTYRLSVELDEQVHNVYAFAGVSGHSLIIPAAYQCATPFGSEIGGASPAFFAIANNSDILFFFKFFIFISAVGTKKLLLLA